MWEVDRVSVKFTDNTAQVEQALAEGVSGFLYEAGQLLQHRARDNVRVDTGQAKKNYSYQVETETHGGTVYVGKPLENAIWEEFGTGEYALNGDGRKGSWVYKSDKDGKFYRTRGKAPTRPLYSAFAACKSTLERRLRELLNGL